MDALWELAEADPTAEVTVDLEKRQVLAEGITADFELDENARWRLLNGLDDISLTLQNEADITAYEASPAVLQAQHNSRPEQRFSRTARPHRPVGGAVAC